MMKEIHETPYVLRQIIAQDPEKLQAFANALQAAHRIYVIGSGTAGIASSQIAFYLRLYGKLDAIGLIGADVQSYYDVFQSDDIILAPSQSGETADVIEVLEHAKQKGMKIGSIINMPGSIMTRMSDYPFMCNAGPEICVMSTKVFTSQIAWGYMLAKTVQGRLEEGKDNLKVLSEVVQRYLDSEDNHRALKALADHLSVKEHIFLLGKYQNFAIMNEGMVKIIEASYKHAHAIPSGDLKHYAITLMEKGVPVVVAVSDDVVKNDVITSINEVRLRGAEVIAIAHKQEDYYDHYISTEDTGETDAIGNIIPIQLLAYYLASKLGNNIDKPRNIAKSVTVK
jgi:glucosamine--fructose-6-phosphate aminotransferase (isomerizing)